MTDQTMQFQAEVARLLHIVTHSLYSEKQIFLRELVSNASDACDRLRYEALTTPDLLGDDPDLAVTLSVDKDARILTVSDNGIGMTRDDLIANLGTIARSGSGAFAEQLTGDAAKDVKLIGQFGVGFYSAFMVAEKVEVVSRRAGQDEAWSWVSDGTGSFTVAEATREGRGTTISLHLRAGEDEFLEPQRLRQIVRTYSDHIALPIRLREDGKDEVINTASALWTRPKSEVTPEQYKEFYHHVAHAFDEPWTTIHAHAEGALEYNLLLFVPTQKPFDLFDPARKHGVKLYVRRVFITDSCEGLVPGWLRFLRGVVDSADLPLNVSREMLQHNPVVAKIRQGLTKRVLTELEKKADKDPEAFATFWADFGAVLKEGIYEDSELRDRILKIARFRTTADDGWVSLGQYIERMKEGQDAIYTISGDDLESLKKSPQLEGFRAKGVEVLLLTDSVDDFWLSMVPTFQDKAFRSATRGGADLGAIKGSEDETKAEADKPAAVEGDALGTLVAAIKLALGDAVKDVRETDRLTDSAVCLVAGDGDMDMHLERMLKLHKRLDKESARVLEINPRHPVIKALAARAGEPGGSDAVAGPAWLLLDQARIVEGEPLPDPAAFARRLAAVMEKGLV